MAKTLNKILEVYAPKSKDEKRFKDKHVVAKYKLDEPTKNDGQFTAGKVKEIDRETTKHGYNPGKDESVYESVHSMALHVKPVKVNGKTKYKVHAVGSHLADGIKVGEHLSDTQLDDATEMGAKIKHLKEDTIEEKKLTPAEMKARERIAKGIEKSNPGMPMSKKMAIATASAKKVAEEVEDIAESENSHKAFQDQHTAAAKTIKAITKSLSDHYDNVVNKKQYTKGEAQWHHVDNIKNINRALEDLHQHIAREVDYSKPIEPMQMRIKESVDTDFEVDNELSELLSAIYDNLSDEGKEIFEKIVDESPEQMLEFLEQLELTDGE